MEQHEEFQFTYSAAQQSEVARIRSKYLPREESKLDQLRRLDRIPTRNARIWALTLGILGALVMGFGMSLTMTELGAILGLVPDWCLPLGVAVGLGGMVLTGTAYPVYRLVLKRQRQKIAPEILRLTEEML